MASKQNTYQKLMEEGNLITGYLITKIDSRQIEDYFDLHQDLSYLARSLWTRIDNRESSPKMDFGDIWSLETLRKIVFSERLNLVEDLDPTVVEQMLADDFLNYFYSHSPSREELIETIEGITIDESSNEGLSGERSIGALMYGLFFAEGSTRRSGKVYKDQLGTNYVPTRGNFKYLADEDWQLLAEINGLDRLSPHETIMDIVITEQNCAAKELLIKDYLEVDNDISSTAIIIQKIPEQKINVTYADPPVQLSTPVAENRIKSILPTPQELTRTTTPTTIPVTRPAIQGLPVTTAPLTRTIPRGNPLTTMQGIPTFPRN